ncbi:ABC transporter ATP-binding protein [Natrinema gelatinilyticum]|uniref:ABC transporter ATP-binding protein n=1 Tax=Natrinema gelatinilyticum TaxID=2961571 RepID=UPI0020C2AACB|nr:ABC transporter ATP-binding protein [Natrinema gelatinilyticum]
MNPLLRCKDITKRFGGIVALDGFGMTVQADAITGLIGPNGAGKTTLFNVVSGVLSPDSGSVIFDGDDLMGRATHELCHAGIARTFQTPHPIKSLTVEENLRVAEAFGSLETDGTDSRLERTLDVLDLTEKRSTVAENLQMTERKHVDLGRALLTDPDLVLLDELLAGLNPTDKATLIEHIQQLHREFDVDFLVVEHDLSAIREMCDDVVVMNEGTFMTAGSPSDVLNDERVQEAYIGT